MTQEPIENIRPVCGECMKPNPQYLEKPPEWFLGKFCKVAFPCTDGRNEYMWIEVDGLYDGEGDEEITGVLNNDPLYAEFTCGDRVAVGRNEIIEVLDP